MQEAVVQVNGGKVRGAAAAGGFVFKGIPYAAPPVGEDRWRAPRPVPAWEGVRDADAFGPDFPQQEDDRNRAGRQDEDCLYLNVWTGSLDAAEKRPVMVWLHGGGFVRGSGSDRRCDGTALAAEGVVVVSFNYRSGLFGFFAHPRLSAESAAGVSGNYGLLDQLAALHWIRENIAGFGGDPDNLTAFGVSAGSASLSLLLASPHAKRAFDRAILHSPGAARPLASLADAEQAGTQLGTDLAQLRSLSGAEVFARTSLLTPKMRGLTTPRVLRPIRDGWLLPEDEKPVFESGRMHRMPLIVGVNLDEGTSLTKTWPIEGMADWRSQIEKNFQGAVDEAARLYPADAGDSPKAAVARMFADTQFNYGARLIARSMSKAGLPVYKYLFSKRLPGAADGPHHGEEVVYAFGTVEDAQEEDRQLSARMRHAWASFARDGVPQLGGSLAWDRYRPAEDNHIEFAAPLRPGAGWRAPQLDFLDRYYAAG
jgi:para-nitrobenzyl esterase